MGKKRTRKKQVKAVTERLAEQVKSENDEQLEKNISEKKQDKTPVRESISKALNDDYETFSAEETQNEETESEEIEEEVVNRPNKFYLVFAVFIIVMSIIGIVSTVQFSVTTVNEIANQTSLKNEIALFLYPIVTVDPPSFKTTEEIPATVVVESAIWRIILTGDNSNYEKLYNTYMYVPAVDVEFSIKTLYGNEAVIQHQTVGSASTSFTYNEDTNTYLVPISPRYTAYSPAVTDISSVGELYTVTVEYMPPSALAMEGIKLDNSAAKTMIYTLSKSRNSMTVHSAKNATQYGEAYEY